VVAAAVLLAAAVAVTIGDLARRRLVLAADAVVVATSVGVVGMATVALHGTKWGFSSLWGDSYFRTQAATRYSEGFGLADYNYDGLPAYYPPALGWLQGRVSDLLGLEGWAAVKPVQLLLAAAIPLLAYALWQRVLSPWPAALVVAATTLVTLHLQKPDEWLVLACLVPWWIEVIRQARRPDVADWSVWRHGSVLGLLLLTHTFFFLPLAIATALGLAVDIGMRRTVAGPVRRALAIGGVGLALSSVYWLAMVLQRLSGAPSDSLQLRYAYEYAFAPPPAPTTGVYLLWAAGFAWLAWAAWQWRTAGRGDRVAGGLALALAGSYLTLLIGAVAVRYDVGLLAFKAGHLAMALQTACGVLALLAGFGWLLQRRDWRHTSLIAATVIGALLAISMVRFFASEWVVGDMSIRAQTTRYADGTWPEGRDGVEPTWYPARVDAGDPSVARVLSVWDELSGGLSRPETVLVTTRVDVLATTPVHAFVPLKSIYSHPNAQFEARLDLLRQVARCHDAACAADLLRDNPYDDVDGLILEQDGGVLSMPVYVDNFPDKTRLSPVLFPAFLFKSPYFERRDVGRLSVIVVN